MEDCGESTESADLAKPEEHLPAQGGIASKNSFVSSHLNRNVVSFLLTVLHRDFRSAEQSDTLVREKQSIVQILSAIMEYRSR